MFLKFFSKFKDMLSYGLNVTILIAGIVAIVIICIIACTKKKEKIPAVLLSTIVSCVCMIFVVTSFNSIVDKKVLCNEHNRLKEELEKQQLELEKQQLELENTNQKLVCNQQTIEIENLNQQLRFLEHSQNIINDFTKINEVNLLETDLSQTSVDTKVIKDLSVVTAESGKLWWKKQTDLGTWQEALSIVTHDIHAKFGFDLNELRFADNPDDPNKIIVWGIKPKFTGKLKDSHKKELSEVRTYYCSYDELKNNSSAETIKPILNELPSGYWIDIDSDNDKKALLFADDCINNFNERLEQGLETEFINDSIVKSAENFITLILAPLEKQIDFFNEAPEGIEEYTLENYLNGKKEKLKRKIKESEDFTKEERLAEINAKIKN